MDANSRGLVDCCLLHFTVLHDVVFTKYYSGFIFNRNGRFNDAIKILKTDLDSSYKPLEALKVDRLSGIFDFISLIIISKIIQRCYKGEMVTPWA